MQSEGKLKFKQIDFNEYDQDPHFKQQAIDKLTYGFSAIKISRKGAQIKKYQFYLLEEDPNYFQWLSEKKNYTYSRIYLQDVHTISYTYRYKISNKMYQSDHENRLVSLVTPTYDLCLYFENKRDRDMFHFAIQYQILQNLGQQQKKQTDQAEAFTNKFFLNADRDGSKQLDFKEFVKEFNKLHTNIPKKQLEIYFKRYDADNSGSIEKAELKKIFRDMLYKNEILEIYLQYCKEAKQMYIDYFKNKGQKVGGVLGEEHQQLNLYSEENEQQNQETIQSNNNLQTEQSKKSEEISGKKEKKKKNQPKKIAGAGDGDMPIIIKDYFKIMTYEEIEQFFKYEQGQLISAKELKDLIENNFLDDYYESTFQNQNKEEIESLKQKMIKEDGKIYDDQNKVSLYQFHNLLFSETNSVFRPEKVGIFQDMTKPLSDYYINSSHNTYLMDNQLTGDSNIQAYINAFLKGSRCVELDIWDGEKQKVPIITHGHTLTSKITFKDVIECINNYAFTYSEYPLILSFENHCSKSYQEQMANIINEILGDKVYIVPQDAENLRTYTNLDKLKNKIIIKGKANLVNVLDNLYPNRDQKKNKKLQTLSSIKKGQTINDLDIDQLANLDDSALLEVEHAQKPQVLIPYSKTEQDKNTLQKNNKENKEKDDDEKDQVEFSGKLANLVTSFGGKFKIDDPNRTPWQISSLNENKLIKIKNKHFKQLVYWHRTFFTRIYPGGLRIDSSNYDPFPGILCGSQVVALNFQTHDLPLLYYLGMFQQNGNTGYILKPKWMRYAEEFKYPRDFQDIVLNMSITVISGQFLRPFDFDTNHKDIVDPFIELSIKGTEEDTNFNKTQSTQIIQDNGFNPTWVTCINDKNRKEFYFQIRCPDLAQLVIQAYDKDLVGKEKLGQNSIPITCLREGFRKIPLRDQKFQIIQNSSLFFHINFHEFKGVQDDLENPNLQQYLKNQISINTQFNTNSNQFQKIIQESLKQKKIKV